MEHFPTINRLHTDVLEDKYGEIHPEVVRHDDSVREAYLVDAVGISRTYALSFFPPELPDEAKVIDAEIRAGGSIGKTFKGHGYEIRKNVLAVFVLDLPEKICHKFRSDNTKAKARLSEFYARKGENEPFIYALVLEVYHPDFRDPRINSDDIAQVTAPTIFLEEARMSKNDIWVRLTSNDWSSVEATVRRAREASITLVESLKKKAMEYMAQ
jgi:hypothetical protein